MSTMEHTNLSKTGTSNKNISIVEGRPINSYVLVSVPLSFPGWDIVALSVWFFVAELRAGIGRKPQK